MDHRVGGVAGLGLGGLEEPGPSPGPAAAASHPPAVRRRVALGSVSLSVSQRQPG